MDSEEQELMRVFLRTWSTIELTPTARLALREDVFNKKAYWAALGLDTSLLDAALDAPHRSWFAQKLQEI